jgi:hypothetical protein
MSDSNTWADRIEREFDAFFRLWRTRRFLAVAFLLGLVLFCAYSVYALYGQNKRISQLETDKTNLTNTNNVLQTENKSLRETVAPLLRQAAKEFPGEEINISLKKLLEKFDAFIPARQTIKTGSVTVEVRIKSDEQVNSHFMDRGGYVAFGKDHEAFLVMAAGDCYDRQLGDGTVIYRGIFQLDAAAPVIGKPLSILEDADMAQVGFKPMPPKSIVLGGKAICTFNSALRMEFSIPAQAEDADFVILAAVKSTIEEALAN